jgi:mRNA-degrading endonuclease RelE of RelBE toxin-antitoxin system
LNRVRLRRDVQRDFDRLSRIQQKAILEKLKSLESDPYPAGSKELEGFAPLRRIKAGDVRAIYDPEPDSWDRIWVWRIGTDHEIYELLGELLEEWARER